MPRTRPLPDVPDPRQKLLGLVGKATTDDDPIAALETLRRAEHIQADVARWLMVQARKAGVTWQDIAQAYSWSTSAAHELVHTPPADRAERKRRSLAESRTRLKDDMPGIGVAAAAKKLGVTRHKIYAMVDHGELEWTKETTANGYTVLRILNL